MISYVSKCAVPIVVVENGTPIAADKEIGKAVVVKIADSYTHSEEAFSAYACALRDIGKCAISIVVVKRASQETRRFVGLSCRAVHQVKIEQSVLIVIDPSAPRAHGFNQKFLGRSGIIVLKGD